MTPARTTIRKAEPEVHFWACFAVVFALVVQALFPIQAMAMPNADGTAYVLCTGDTSITAATSTKSKPVKDLMGLKCADCVLASITAVQTAPPVDLPDRYSLAETTWRSAADTSTIRARAPPRPHSCGPPASITA